MSVKITRKTLMIATGSLGVLLIVYSLVKFLVKFSFDEKIEKYLMEGIVFAALGLFMYNRKLASDEKKAREAAEAEVQKALMPEQPDEKDENLPHWERRDSDEEG
jgi:hypothetical protein